MTNDNYTNMDSNSSNDSVDAELRDKLDNALNEFLGEYEHGLEAARNQGHNTDYHTFDSKVAFLDTLEQLLTQAWYDLPTEAVEERE